MPTLMELLAQGGANIKAGFNSMKGGPAAPPPYDFGSDVFKAPANFASPGYQKDDFGNFYRVDENGVARQFDPTQQQQADLAAAGMPDTTESAAIKQSLEGKQPNIMGGEDALKVTNALASALQQSQANKPKLQQAQDTSAGSVLQPKNTLLDLLAQTSVRRNK